MDNGFIILHRKLLNWEWIQDPIVPRLWMYCLLRANWQESKWKGITIPRGSFISGRHVIAADLAITEDQVRTACQKLKSTNNITVKSTNKYSLYTIVNYDEYQNNDAIRTSKIPNKHTPRSPTNPQQIPTDNNNNKETIKTINKSMLDGFWERYPRKVSKIKTIQIWNRINPDEATYKAILEALEIQKKSEQWTRDSGQFIPHPSTWLSQERWKDRLEPIKEISWKDQFLKGDAHDKR